MAGGWSGGVIYYINWISFNLSVIRIFILRLICYSERNFSMIG